jgi:short-subunit dehydrogenase
MNKYIILGASRGLGKALFSQLIYKQPESQFLLVSRRIESDETINGELVKKLNQDFSRVPVDQNFYQQIISFQPNHIVYCAGGGPYGLFQSKKWADHEWSLNVNFNYPAQFIHKILFDHSQFSSLKSITCVGSAIAESSPDSMAASYAAGKHALKGLITSLKLENDQSQSSDSKGHSIKLQLFSPGYIKTDLLPQNSAPRLNNLAQDVSIVAGELADMIDSASEVS